MQCPRDNSALKRVTINAKSYHKCPQCKGVFFPLTGTAISGVKVANLKPKDSVCIANKTSGEGVLESPVGKVAMQRFAYQGVHLDYCAAENAVWLDGGELETLAANVSAMKSKNARQQRADSGESSWLGEVAVEAGLEVAFEFVVGAVETVLSPGDWFDL